MYTESDFFNNLFSGNVDIISDLIWLPKVEISLSEDSKEYICPLYNDAINSCGLTISFSSAQLVISVLKQLHQQKCKIVFLTRNALALESDLSFFQSGDFIGVSISENNPFNSNFLDIRRLFLKAKERNIFTWISLEPVLTYEFARQVIHSFQDVTDFFRVGKNDLIDSSYWQPVKRKIESLNIPTVFVKN